MNQLVEIVAPNHLTLNEHVKRINVARDKIKEGMFEFVDAIQLAYEQLPEDTFQGNLAKRLGMNKSVLSKWLSIGGSEYLTSKRTKLPPTFSTLYDLTQLEKKYVDKYGTADGHRRIDDLIKTGKISPKSEQSSVRELVNEVNRLIKIDQNKKRQKKVLSLSGGSLKQSPSSTKTMSQLVSSKNRFKSFVVIPPPNLLKKWGDEGYFESDISNEFPLHELRSPSTVNSIQCLIKIPMNRIGVGLKMLGAFGFTYRDTLVPSSNSSGYTVLGNEDVVIRGERGTAKKLMVSSCPSLNTDDLLKFAEEIGKKPNLLVFGETNRSGWMCLKLP